MSNESIINKFLVKGNSFMPELHLIDPKVGKYSACGPFSKHKDRVQKYKETGDVNYIYKNELDKACFIHDAAYSNYRDVPNRLKADSDLMNDVYKIMKSNLDGYQRGLSAMIYKFFQKKIQLGQGIKKEIKTNDWKTDLATELHKPIRRKFPTRKVKSFYVDQIWSADLVDMQNFSKLNKGYRYLLTVIDLFSRYAFAIALKDKTGKSLVEAFTKIINLKDGHNKPDKLWTDNGSEFYNKLFLKFLDDNDIEIYSTFNQAKAVVVERFNRTLKEKMWKYFTRENTYKWIDVIDKLVNDYNNTYHHGIKMKPIEVTNFNLNIIDDLLIKKQAKSSKLRRSRALFRVNDNVRISKYKRPVFDKGYTPNWSEEIFVITKVQNTVPVTYKIKDLNNEEIKGSFYKQELQKAKVTDVFRIEKVIKRKGDKIYVKWKGYPNSFNSWVNKNDYFKI